MSGGHPQLQGLAHGDSPLVPRAGTRSPGAGWLQHQHYIFFKIIFLRFILYFSHLNSSIFSGPWELQSLLQLQLQECPSAGSQVGDVDISPGWPGSGKCLKALPPFLHQRFDSNIPIMLFPQGLRELFKTRALTKADLGSHAVWSCKGHGKLPVIPCWPWERLSKGCEPLRARRCLSLSCRVGSVTSGRC